MPTNHLIPTEKHFVCFSQGGMLCFCIPWVVQNTRQHPFSIHVGRV